MELSIFQACVNVAMLMRATGGPLSSGDISGAGFDMAAVVHVSAIRGFVRSTSLEVWKVMLPDTQSINRLWQASQLCPRSMENRLFEGKQVGSSTAFVIMELVLLSESLSGMGLMEWVGILNFQMSKWSMKQWVELESTKAFSEACRNDLEAILNIKDVDEGIELVLSFTFTCMCTESIQPPAHTEVSGLLTNFLLWMHQPLTCPLHQLPRPLSLASTLGSL